MKVPPKSFLEKIFLTCKKKFFKKSLGRNKKTKKNFGGTFILPPGEIMVFCEIIQGEIIS